MGNFYRDNKDIEETIDLLDLSEVATLLEEDFKFAKEYDFAPADDARIANRKHLRFSELVDDSTPTPIVVVTFLAVLELYKRNMIFVTQPKPFGDIVMTYREGSGELLLEGDDAITSSIEGE